MGTMGAAFAAVYCGAQAMRGTDDEINSAIAGAVGGALIGIQTRVLWRVGAYSAATSLGMWFFHRMAHEAMEVQGLTLLERSDKRTKDGFFAVPPRNPFAGMKPGTRLNCVREVEEDSGEGCGRGREQRIKSLIKVTL